MTRDEILALAKANIDDGHGLAASPGELLRFAAAIRKAALLEAAEWFDEIIRSTKDSRDSAAASALRRMAEGERMANEKDITATEIGMTLEPSIGEVLAIKDAEITRLRAQLVECRKAALLDAAERFAEMESCAEQTAQVIQFQNNDRQDQGKEGGM